MSSSFKPPLSKLLIRDFFFFFFGLLWFQINSLCISFSWIIVELGKATAEAKCIILKIANVLKILIFPSSVKFLILQIFKTASILCVWFLIRYWGMSRDSCNLNFFPKYFLKVKRGIIVHSWKFPSNSLLTHEYYRLAILDGMSSSFKPPLSKLLIIFFFFFFLWSFMIPNKFFMYFI